MTVCMYYIHCRLKKLDHFLFKYNFGKYCPMLILSLLQTEINHDQAYPKIYHHTSNLLVHYEQECIGQRCWHDLVIKDVTVKQITLNVTNMDKINTVSSQAVLKMSSFSMDTRLMSSSSLWSIASSKIDCSRPHQTSISRHINSSTLWICLW